MQMKKYSVDELIPALYNPRKKLTSDDKEYQKIKKSIQEFGYVEPIIINKDKTIIGGHQRLTVLKDLGYKEVEVIEIDIDKTKEKALNIALNKITGEWDIDKLNDLLIDLDEEKFNLEITGFDLEELKDLINPIEEIEKEIENIYTKKVKVPQYEITGEEPNINDLVDEHNTNKLIEKINNSNVSDEQKIFLKKAAQRLLKFDYKNIAEYYAHQSKEMQSLMEDLALVIIDIEDAIANGYVELSKTLEDMLEDGN